MSTPKKMGAKPPVERKPSDKQYELVQLWRKRDFPYADPMDATEDEMAVSKYKALVNFILLKVKKGFNLDGQPRYKIASLNLPDSAHPKQLTRKHGSDVVESRFGIAMSSFRIPAKMPEILESLRDHPMCWQPESKDPWKSQKEGKAFYVREQRDDAKSALERAVVSGPTMNMEDNHEPEDIYSEGEEVVFEDAEVEELV